MRNEALRKRYVMLRECCGTLRSVAWRYGTLRNVTEALLIANRSIYV